MTLLDLRRYAIRRRVRVGFSSPGAGECIVSEHGLLQIPSLAGVPGFQFDSSLAGVERFVLTPVEESGRPQTISRRHLETLVSAGAGVDGGQNVE